MNPRIDFDLLEKHKEGLIVSSACLSSVINSNLLHDRYDQAKRAATRFKDIFGDDFFLEVMYHGIDAEAAIIPLVFQLGKELNIKIIASGDVHYGTKDMGKSHEVLMAISTSKCLNDPKHLHFPYDEFYLKSAEEMAKIFGTQPEVLLNTVELAERIDANDIVAGMNIGMRLPRYDVPEGFSSPIEYMSHLAWEGMKKIGWDQSHPHVERLKMEISDVKIALDSNKYDFPTYFLIVRDYINEANKRGILTGPGRGSGAASVLLRTLGITYGVDPIKHKLVWERFLGFDVRHFINDSDFGFENKENTVVQIISDDSSRDLEDDLGGIDRY